MKTAPNLARQDELVLVQGSRDNPASAFSLRVFMLDESDAVISPDATKEISTSIVSSISLDASVDDKSRAPRTRQRSFARRDRLRSEKRFAPRRENFRRHIDSSSRTHDRAPKNPVLERSNHKENSNARWRFDGWWFDGDGR